MSKIIQILFFLILVVFPFGVLAQIPLGLTNLSEVNLYLIDILVGLFVLSGGLRSFKLGLPLIFFPVVALISLTANSFKLTQNELLVSFLYWLRFSAYLLIIPTINNLKNMDAKQLICYLKIIGTAMAGFGLIQLLLYPDLDFLTYLNWDPHFNRIVGTLLDPNYLGIIVVLTLILVIKDLNNRIWNWIWLLFLLVILFLTYSRGSYLAFGISLVILVFYQKYFRQVVIIGLVSLSIFLLVPKNTGGEGVNLARTASIYSRISSWQEAIELFQENPLIGVGFNSYRYATKMELHNHAGAGNASSLLLILATTGIIGILAFFYGGIAIWKKANLVTKTSLGALFIHSIFINSLFFPWVMWWIFYLIAMDYSE